MFGDILWILLILWLISAFAPLNNGAPFIARPATGYGVGEIIAALLVVLIVVKYLVPSLRPY